jgi:putative MATE family efflux protein
MAPVSREQMLSGPIVKTLIILGGPVMASELLQSLYSLVDTFWLGHLGPLESTHAVAALQISWPIVFLLIAVSFGFGSAGIALVSQYIGAGDQKEAESSAGQILLLSILFGLVIGLVGYLLSPLIVVGLGIQGDTVPAATIYLQIISLGMPFMCITMIFGFIIRATGDTVTPMKVEGVTVLINMVVDPLLIFGLLGLPRLGVMGAALATIFSQFIAAVIALWILFSGRAGIRLHLSHLKPLMERIVQIFKIGIPASIGNSGTAFGFVILMGIIAQLPNQNIVLAAYGVANRITDLLFIAIYGLEVGVSTMVGQCLGADNQKRAEEVARRGMAIMFIILLTAAAGLFLIREEIIHVFIANTEVVAEGANFIKIFVFGMAFFGIFRAVIATFVGSGHNIPTMILEIIRLWGFRIPLVLLFGFFMGWETTGVWIALAVSNVLSAAISLVLYKTDIWKEKVIKQ